MEAQPASPPPLPACLPSVRTDELSGREPERVAVVGVELGRHARTALVPNQTTT